MSQILDTKNINNDIFKKLGTTEKEVRKKMIFGNPGVYDESGNFSNFAIQVDKLDAEFSSLNLILDMRLYPSYLAYNMSSVLLAGLDLNSDIFNREDRFLYNLSEEELMVELIKRSFPSLFGIEKIINRKNIDYNLIMKDESILFDYVDEIISKENISVDRNNLWEIDDMEYFNRGVYPFIVNFNGFTKVIVIKRLNEAGKLGELSRFFHNDMTLRNDLQFFSKEFWRVDIAELKTIDFKKIILDVHKFLLGEFV